MTDHGLRVGLVGCGRLAERGYLPALAQAAGVVLAAAADGDVDRARALAPGVPAFASAAELLAGADVDLLVLAHAAPAHVPDACAAAAAGVPSLVEKPPACTACEAEALLRLGSLVWMGFDRRFGSGLAAARDRLAAEPPERLELEMSTLPGTWRAYGGSAPVLLDLGPHMVDLALWLTGQAPARVRVETATEHEAAFTLELDGGTTADLRISHRRAWRERVVARDGTGAAETLVARGGLARRIASRARPGGASPLVATLAAQLAAVASAVRGGSVDPRLAAARDGVAVMRVLDAAARGGRAAVDA